MVGCISITLEEVFEIRQGRGGDGELRSVDLEEIEIFTRNSSRHGEENAYQTRKSEAKWHSDTNKAPKTHLDVVVAVLLILVVVGVVFVA